MKLRLLLVTVLLLSGFAVSMGPLPSDGPIDKPIFRDGGPIPLCEPGDRPCIKCFLHPNQCK